jgi:membrane-associated protease RseP (regulator of RpoE activity)
MAEEAKEFHKQLQIGPVQISVDAKANAQTSESPAEVQPGEAPAEVSEYWLGVACNPVPEALGSQLALGEHLGLLVRQVVPESPAAKAGILRDDVLVKASGKLLANPEDLIAVVNAGKDKKIALELIREGKKTTVTVQPEKRPEHMVATAGKGWGDEADMRALQGWLDHLMPNEGSPMQFHIVRPGAILPSGASVYPNLPDNVTVTITKHGEEPAKIAVHQGDKKWEVTEKELDKLPKDVRPYVDQMLSPFWRGNVTFSRKGAAGFAAPWTGAPLPAPEMGPPGTHLQKRLDDMSRQIEEMQKSLEQMRKKDPKPSKP